MLSEVLSEVSNDFLSTCLHDPFVPRSVGGTASHSQSLVPGM